MSCCKAKKKSPPMSIWDLPAGFTHDSSPQPDLDVSQPDRALTSREQTLAEASRTAQGLPGACRRLDGGTRFGSVRSGSRGRQTRPVEDPIQSARSSIIPYREGTRQPSHVGEMRRELRLS
ncbi:hypothetical protein PC116_g23545 [Phytophthora cactorum]|nr:hypothetical protein PC116_g23545 [Phytophthora cactorum]